MRELLGVTHLDNTLTLDRDLLTNMAHNMTSGITSNAGKMSEFISLWSLAFNRVQIKFFSIHMRSNFVCKILLTSSSKDVLSVFVILRSISLKLIDSYCIQFLK